MDMNNLAVLLLCDTLTNISLYQKLIDVKALIIPIAIGTKISIEKHYIQIQLKDHQKSDVSQLLFCFFNTCYKPNIRGKTHR